MGVLMVIYHNEVEDVITELNYKYNKLKKEAERRTLDIERRMEIRAELTLLRRRKRLLRYMN
ncbi:hypothetical protein D3C78_1847980 [compost metagenome]|jgi:hypothetical protein